MNQALADKVVLLLTNGMTVEAAEGFAVSSGLDLDDTRPLRPARPARAARRIGGMASTIFGVTGRTGGASRAASRLFVATRGGKLICYRPE